MEIAKKIEGDERGVDTLLRALVSLKLLDMEDDLFGNTTFSQKHLVRTSQDYIGHIIMHHHHLVDGWGQLDKAVITGRSVDMRDHGEANERESFLMGMFNLATLIAPELAKQINLDGRKHLLDLGGGPGTHAAYFCLENPGLKATIFDRETTRAFAEEIVGHFGLQDRISFMAGNFNEDGLGGPYDVAWLSQILHSNGPEECERLIAKTVAALEPGGLIMIHDFFLDDSKTKPLFPALFSLNMLINNDQGRSYSGKEISRMLEKTGASNIVRLPFQGPNDSYVLCATV